MRVLAGDLGASALKAALWEEGGALLALAEAPVAFEEDGAGRSEIAPARWRAAFDAALAALAAEAGLSGVGAVAVCGMTRTQVLTDAAGRALAPAIGVRDSRAAGLAAAAARALEGIAEAARLDAGHPAARLLWLRRERPEAWARAAAVLEPKDWLLAALTGEVGSDPVSMERLTAAWEGGLSAALGLADLRPPLSAPTAPAGTVRRGLSGPAAALAGAAAFRGSHDAWTAAAGLGALEAGSAYVISGTTESAGLLAPAPAEAEGLLTVRWGEGLWQIGGPGLNGASVLDWAAGVLASAEPGEARPGAPLFLPFLRGERTPYWDASLRAGWLGVGAEHGAADLARAAMEGLGFLNREVIERAEAAAGLVAARVLLGGGGARGRWAELRAAALGRPVSVPAVAHAGLTGGLAVALAGLGRHADVTAAARAAAGPARVVEVPAEVAERAAARFALWREAVAATAAIPARLSRL